MSILPVLPLSPPPPLLYLLHPLYLFPVIRVLYLLLPPPSLQPLLLLLLNKRYNRVKHFA
jgi:hypothetical protein